MAEKADKDREIEDRIRAHVRQKMTEREWTVTRTADEFDHDQGNLSRILLGSRGISAGLAHRISRALAIPLDDLFHRNPSRRYWGYYVPKPPKTPGSASSSAVQKTRQVEPGTGATPQHGNAR